MKRFAFEIIITINDDLCGLSEIGPDLKIKTLLFFGKWNARRTYLRNGKYRGISNKKRFLYLFKLYSFVRRDYLFLERKFFKININYIIRESTLPYSCAPFVFRPLFISDRSCFQVETRYNNCVCTIAPTKTLQKYKQSASRLCPYSSNEHLSSLSFSQYFSSSNTRRSAGKLVL